jgi:outer membrane lipoprotein-sorting protein
LAHELNIIEKNKMKTLIFIITTLTCLNFYAQEQDLKAKAILDDVSKTTKAYKTISTDYSLIVANKEKKQTDKQTGKIQVKGTKFRLEIPGNTIMCDGKTVWTFNKEANEVSVKNYEASADDAMDPTKIFTMYENGYKYKFDKEESGLSIVNLYPSVKPEKKKFHTIKLYVDKSKKQVKKLIMLMKDGGTQTYELKSLTSNVEIADNQFVFDAKACKCEVIDER